MKKFFFIFMMIVLAISILINIASVREYVLLTKKIESIKSSDQGKSFLTVGLLMEVLKKQHLSKSDINELFTYNGESFIAPINTKKDFFWEAYNYHNIDRDYNKNYEEVYEFIDIDLYILFNNDTLSDYRYRFSDRKRLDSFLANGTLE